MKIGAVSYLNTKPLVYEMAHARPDVDLIFDLPSRLADRLASGDLDVALIPAIEAVGKPDYTVVSNACIGCRGPVWSVKLLSKVPFRTIRTLALDEGSRTSVALVRILLKRIHQVEPDVSPFPIGHRLEELQTDAALIIGDRAMTDRFPAHPFQWDLGEAWTAWTGTPFVFAVWTAATREPTSWLEPLLERARDAGLANLESIAQLEAPRYRLTVDACLGYLRDHLHFHLGQAERRGLQRFLTEAAKLNLLPSASELNFHDCQATG